MAATFGKIVKVTVFGQSHSDAIGCVVDGIPAGLSLDMAAIDAHMKRRAPGRGNSQADGKTITARSETDQPHIVSGVLEGVTCGAPICAVIENKDQRSKDYSQFKACPRPSHADYPAFLKYGKDYHDIRGGGQFSGRLTAPLCFAGAVCMQYLAQFGVKIQAQLVRVGGETDSTKFGDVIREAAAQGDSVGGVIACTVEGFPGGIGDPIYDALESRLSSVLFAVPAVKGVEFGDGFALADAYGSQVNDLYTVDGAGQVSTKSNHNGGILGGISTGMPISLRVAFKPTPSIAKPQSTLNLEKQCEVEQVIGGRHDPCVAVRAVPVIESAVACVLTDYMVQYQGGK